MENKPLKKSVINLYGLPSFGFQLFVTVELMFLAAFLTDYVKLPLQIANALLLITSIFDVIWVPTAGIILEKSNLRWGKYRSWLLIGPPIGAIFYTLQFSQVSNNDMITALVILIGFVVSHLVFNTYYSAHIAMNNALTTVREERNKMASNRGMLNALGSIVFSYFGVKAVTQLGIVANNPVLGYTFTVIIVGILMTLSYWIYFGITKDYANNGTEKQSGKTEKMTVKEMLHQLIINPPLIGLMLVELGRYLGKFIILGMSFYYFKYVIDDLLGLAIFMTGLTVVNFFAAMIAAPIANKFGEKKTYIVSMLIFIAGLLLVWALPLEASTFKVLMFIAYIGFGMPDSLSVAMYSATVDYSEWKTGKNARGFIMSLLTFPIKTSNFIKSIIIAAVLASVNYVADMPSSAELIQGIKNGFALYPAIIMLIGVILMSFLYTLTPEKLDEMNEEIAKRKKG